VYLADRVAFVVTGVLSPSKSANARKRFGKRVLDGDRGQFRVALDFGSLHRTTTNSHHAVDSLLRWCLPMTVDPKTRRSPLSPFVHCAAITVGLLIVGGFVFATRYREMVEIEAMAGRLTHLDSVIVRLNDTQERVAALLGGDFGRL
jgi:hypothetical protein